MLANLEAFQRTCPRVPLSLQGPVLLSGFLVKSLVNELIYKLTERSTCRVIPTYATTVKVFFAVDYKASVPNTINLLPSQLLRHGLSHAL